MHIFPLRDTETLSSESFATLGPLYGPHKD